MQIPHLTRLQQGCQDRRTVSSTVIGKRCRSKFPTIHSQKQIKELEFVTRRYEENLGEPLRAVKEDVEKEWLGKVEALEEKLRMKDSYVQECERALEKERQVIPAHLWWMD